MHTQLIIALIVFARCVSLSGADAFHLHLGGTRTARLARAGFFRRGFGRGGRGFKAKGAARLQRAKDEIRVLIINDHDAA